MASPLVRTIQLDGGSFYAFSSGARDFTKTINNTQLNFEFSNFACLNIPNIETPSSKENFLQFHTIDGANFASNPLGIGADQNINLIQSLQNYALNFEDLLLNDNNYDSTNKKSVAERVFFKWLKELGAVRFKEAISTEKNPAITSKRFVEESTQTSGTQRYQRVIEYLGSIDAINNVDKAGEAYTEVFINIPTTVGTTPVILMQALSDVNYQSDMIIKPSPDNEYINGRGTATIHPDGLSIEAFYDYDAGIIYTDPNANWHGSLTTNTYFTEPITFEDPSNILITKDNTQYGGGWTDITYLRSKLDGISIDFDPESYTDIVIDPAVNTIQEYNSVYKSKNFEFNAVLIYYDIYETSNPNNRATNLYGILFLNNVTPTTQGGFIDRTKKIKPNSITGLNGNAYSLTFNLKTDTSIENSTVFRVINDYSTFSMDLFIDASTQMQEAVKILTETQSQYYDVVNRVNELENSVYTSENVTELKGRLDQLEIQLQNSNKAFSNSTAILDLVAKNSDDIHSILNGSVPLNLQYNTDVLKPGDGILLDKSVPNKIKIVNNNQQYNLNQIYSNDTYTTLITNSVPLNLNQTNVKAYTKLKNFTNLIRFNTINSALTNLKIYIDDQVIRFKEGQSIRIVFDTDLNINGKNIIIYTDKLNKFGNGSLNMSIGVLASTDLMGIKPIIEITCLDEINYTFSVDVLR